MITINEYYTELISDRIYKYESTKPNQIFVLLGQSSLVDINKFADKLSDIDTFNIESDEQVFNKEWFSKLFTILNINKDFHLISFPQFSYLINYIDPTFFIDRIVIIKDNLRQLYPIKKTYT